MVQERPALIEANDICKERYCEVADWIRQFATADDPPRLVRTLPTDIRVSLEIMNDDEIVGVRSFDLGGIKTESVFRLRPEGLCYLREVHSVSMRSIRVTADTSPVFTGAYFEKLSPEKRAEYTQQIVDRVKFDLELAGLLPKR